MEKEEAAVFRRAPGVAAILILSPKRAEILSRFVTAPSSVICASSTLTRQLPDNHP